jgi:hypothetical protein
MRITTGILAAPAARLDAPDVRRRLSSRRSSCRVHDLRRAMWRRRAGAEGLGFDYRGADVGTAHSRKVECWRWSPLPTLHVQETVIDEMIVDVGDEDREGCASLQPTTPRCRLQPGCHTAEGHRPAQCSGAPRDLGSAPPLFSLCGCKCLGGSVLSCAPTVRQAQNHVSTSTMSLPRWSFISA